MWYLLEEGVGNGISNCCGWHHLPLKVQSIGLDSWGKKRDTEKNWIKFCLFFYYYYCGVTDNTTYTGNKQKKEEHQKPSER